MITVNHSLIPGVLILTDKPVDDETYYKLDHLFGSAKHVIHRENTDSDPERYVKGFNGLLEHLDIPPCQSAQARNDAVELLVCLPNCLGLDL